MTASVCAILISAGVLGGGNAFHHHQDLNQLCEAWRRPETVVVHEQYWTAQAKFSDIVLPVTTSLEREDIGAVVTTAL